MRIKRVRLKDGTSVRVVERSWDWKEGMDIPTIALMLEAIQPYGMSKKIYAYEADTDGDYFAMLLTDERLDQDQVYEAWRLLNEV